MNARLTITMLAAAGAGVILVPEAAAQSAAATSDGQSFALEEVVVTANRRLSSTREIPFSIQAIDATEIQQKNLQRFQDYLGEIPGVGFGNRGEGRNDVFLRGISSPGVGRSAVGVYIDEIPLAFSGFQPDSNLYDMERIEVLKGPQGTLYGEGALGGAIKLITQKPQLDQFAANGQVTVSDPKGGRIGSSFNAMLNIPLISDKLAVRLVGSRNSEGGWIDNLRTGQDDVNRSRTTSTRAQIAFAPTDDVNLLFTYLGLRGRVDGQTFADLGARELEVQHRPFAEPTRQNSDTYNLTAQIALGGGTLTMSASQAERSLDELTWEAMNSAQIGEAFGIPDYVLQLYTWSDFDISSQEIRYVSSGESRLRYVVGAFHKKRKQPFVAIVPNSPLTAGLLPDELYDNVVKDQDDETAAFGELTYDITPALHATAGARFSREKNDVQSDLFIFYAGQIPRQSGKATHESVSPRLALSYDLGDTQTFYATVGKGYRAGGANYQIDPTQGDPLSYDPDTAINYEIGHKATWLGGRLSSEVALYHMDWRDIQVFGNSPDGARSFTLNGGRASSTGAELELRARPTRNLTVALGASMIDAQYESDIPIVGVVDGTDLPFAPEFSGFASANYTFALPGDIQGSLLGEVQHIGKRLDSIRQPLDAYTTFDLRLGLRRGNYEVTLFGRNLFDEVAPLDNVRGLAAQIPSQPRTYGITLTASY